MRIASTVLADGVYYMTVRAALDAFRMVLMVVASADVASHVPHDSALHFLNRHINLENTGAEASFNGRVRSALLWASVRGEWSVNGSLVPS